MATSKGTPSATGKAAKVLVKKAGKMVVKKAGTAVVSAVGWPAILIAAAVMLLIGVVLVVFVVVVIIAGSSTSADTAMFAYQCQSRLGASVGYAPSVLAIPNSADPSGGIRIPVQPATTTAAATTSSPAPTTAATTTASSMPSTNPYASLSVDPSAAPEARACAAALRSGALVAPRRTDTTASGSAIARAAAALADGSVIAAPNAGSAAGPANNRISAANLVRYSLTAARTGTSRTATSHSAAPRTTTTAPARPTTSAASPADRELPTSLADLIALGDRVDPTAISPGDLVYYNFTATGGPTGVVIALNATTGISADVPDRPVQVVSMPTGNVIAKRVITP